MRLPPPLSRFSCLDRPALSLELHDEFAGSLGAVSLARSCLLERTRHGLDRDANRCDDCLAVHSAVGRSVGLELETRQRSLSDARVDAIRLSERTGLTIGWKWAARTGQDLSGRPGLLSRLKLFIELKKIRSPSLGKTMANGAWNCFRALSLSTSFM